MGRFRNNFKTGIYPATPSTLIFTVFFVLGLKLLGIDISFQLINWARNHTFGEYSRIGTILMTCIFGVVLWLFWVQLLRYILKMLLKYRGWMYEPRGKMSLMTRCWLFTVHKFSKFDPMLHSYQGALPRLPLPKLDDTLNTHLESVRPILDDAAYEEMVRLTEDFRKDGKRFQWYLWLKSLFSTNYVTDWWEEYVYLRNRHPIMINSNYYGIDTIFNHPTTNQAARAANVVRSALAFRRQLDKQELKPIMHGGVPLCSAQYERLFNTCRIPGVEADVIKHWRTSRHIAVYHKGRWWKFPVHTTKRLLTAVELQTNFQKILDSDSEPFPGEKHLGALTAGKRIPWAQARKRYFSTGVNKNSLLMIESAAFSLILDEEEYHYDPDDYSKLDTWALAMLHGKGYDRWFDKTFNLIVSSNGRTGLNCEHSWADAPIMSHLFEATLLFEHLEDTYTEDGNCARTSIDESGETFPAPERLKWDIPDECCDVIESSLAVATELLSDVELKLLIFKEYGKGFMKKAKVSPDAYIQFALHLTYYNMHGDFPLTYEACMTRLYREARTETVRAVTSESIAFARAFLDPSVPASEKVRMMRTAAEKHVRLYRDGMAGKGVDRHLFALYVVSRYLEVESPFLEKVLKEPWHLSTSQTPHQQTTLIDLNKNPQFVSAGGGFGPVSDEGYGVSYIVGGEDMLSFHISAKKNVTKTSAEKFRDTLIETLRQLKSVVEEGCEPKLSNGTAAPS
jgi:carnitine O-palmitoyltransferase 1